MGLTCHKVIMRFPGGCQGGEGWFSSSSNPDYAESPPSPPQSWSDGSFLEGWVLSKTELEDVSELLWHCILIQSILSSTLISGIKNCYGNKTYFTELFQLNLKGRVRCKHIQSSGQDELSSETSNCSHSRVIFQIFGNISQNWFKGAVSPALLIRLTS